MTDHKRRHTPGPWTAHCFQVRAGRDVITHTGGHLPPSRAHESEANARLIAAAPDMLEVLTNIVDCYGVGSTPEAFCRNVRDFIEQGRKAIAKAVAND